MSLHGEKRQNIKYKKRWHCDKILVNFDKNLDPYVLLLSINVSNAHITLIMKNLEWQQCFKTRQKALHKQWQCICIPNC